MKKPEDFVVIKEKTPNGVKFTLKGRIYANNADILLSELDVTLKEGDYNIVLNMLWVEFLSSSGIRVILKGYKDAKKAGGSLRIEMPSENVKNVLGMVVLDELLIK